MNSHFWPLTAVNVEPYNGAEGTLLETFLEDVTVVETDVELACADPIALSVPSISALTLFDDTDSETIVFPKQLKEQDLHHQVQQFLDLHHLVQQFQ